MAFLIPDPRPWPDAPVKNELLTQAAIVAKAQQGENVSPANLILAQSSLASLIHAQLAQNHYLGLSVAMAMASDAAQYRVLWRTLNQVLTAPAEAAQWVALPVIAIVGSKTQARFDMTLPEDGLKAAWNAEPALAALAKMTWHSWLLDAAELANITAGQWFQAASDEGAAQLWRVLPQHALHIAPGQEALTLFALGRGKIDLASVDQAWRPHSMAQMQLWSGHWSQAPLTVFANPLPPATPLAALHAGVWMRQIMAFDLWATQALRTLRLQHPDIGFVAAALEDGRLAFEFGAMDASIAPQTYYWPLAPQDSLDAVVRHVLDFLRDCQIESAYFLSAIHPLAPLPGFQAALLRPGVNPLSSSGQA